MDLLEGLSSKQINLIRGCLKNRRFEKNDIVFREGDAAESFYIILSGHVEILRETDDKPMRLAKLGPNDIFGEMGMLINAGRTAAARAMEPTTAYEIPANLVELMKSGCGAEPTLKFLQNLVCILAERLREHRMLPAKAPRSLVMRRSLTVARDMETALEIVKKSLPKGPIKWLERKRRLQPGQVLCNEGDPSDGFYFIHEGVLTAEASRGKLNARIRIGTLTAPVIAGEYGFFTGQPRTATLTAYEPTAYVQFTKAHWDKLKTKFPTEAMNVLFAMARMAGYLLADD